MKFASIFFQASAIYFRAQRKDSDKLILSQFLQLIFYVNDFENIFAGRINFHNFVLEFYKCCY